MATPEQHQLVHHRVLSHFVETGRAPHFTDQLALRKARVATKVAPDSLACRTTLGIALFRLGKHSSALEMLQQTDEDYSRIRNTRRANSDARDHVLRTAYMAMTLHELNQSPASHEMLTHLKSNMKQNSWVHEDIHQAIREASQLMGYEE